MRVLIVSFANLARAFLFTSGSGVLVSEAVDAIVYFVSSIFDVEAEKEVYKITLPYNVTHIMSSKAILIRQPEHNTTMTVQAW